TWSGAITLGATSEVQIDDSTTLTMSGGFSGTFDLAIDSAGTSTISNAIATSTGALTKSGAGTLTLSGTNTFSGSTTVSAGTLIVGSSAALGDTGGATSVTSGATLQLGAYSIGEPLTINGTGVSSSGALYFSAGGTVTGTVALGSASTIQVASTYTGTIQGVISGSTTLSKSGAGILLLSGANTHSGATNVDAGTLKLGAAGVLSDSTAVTVASGATFDLNSNAETIGSIAGAGSITLSANLTSGGDNSSTEFSGTTSAGAGKLIKSGSGTLTLSGDNLHTGGLTISGGAVSVATDSKLGAVPGSVSAASITLGGGTLKTTGTFTLSTTRGITLSTGSGTIEVATGTTLTYGGVITGASLNVTKTGSGTLVLSGTNTYTGTTTISAGTLSVSADANLGTAPGSVTAASITLDGGTLAASGSFTLNSNRGVTLGASHGTVDVASGATLTYGGVIAGASKNLTKTGSGTLLLSGVNSYTGTTTISAGTLQQGAAGVLSDSTAVTVTSGATWNLGGFSETVASIAGGSTATISLGTGSLSNTLTVGGSNASTTYAGDISGSGGKLTKTGTGVLTLTGDTTFTGTLTISGGTVQLGSGGTTGSVATMTIVNNGTLDVNRSTLLTYAGDISGTGGVTISGSGGLSLTGTNTFSGAVTVASGNLTLDRDSCGSDADKTIAFGNIVNNSTITFALDEVGVTCTYPSVMSGTGGIVKTGASTLVFTGSNTYSGTTVVNGGTLRLGGSTGERIADTSAVSVGTGATFDVNGRSERVGSIAGAGNVVLGAGTLTSGDTSDTTFSGVISGAGDLVKLGSGTLTLSGTNTFTGSTTISAGAIAVSADAGLGATSAEVLMNGGTLSATDSFTLDASRGVTLSTGATSTVTVASTKTLLAAGVISGSGNLTKSGAGTITLTGANSFTGTFTVSVGAAVVGDGATSGSLATTSIVTNADLSFSRSDNVSSSAAITGTGGLTKLGNGTLTLTNTGTSYSGTTTISAGTLALGGSGVVGDSSTVDVATGATFSLEGYNETIGALAGSGTLSLGSGTLTAGGNSSSTTFSGTSSGTGGLTKTGSGTLTLSGANGYTGTTTISGGTLALGAADRIDNSSNVVVGNGATFSLANFNETVGSLSTSPSAGTGAISLGTATLTTSTTADSTFGGVVSGSGALVKQGSGVLTLSGANTYSGTTTISAGSIQAANATALGTTAGATTVSNGAQLRLSGSITSQETITGAGIGGLSGVILNVSGANTLSGAITLTQSSNEVQVNAGSLTLSGGITSPTSSTFVVDTATSTTLTVSTSGISGSGVAIDKYGLGTFVIGADSALSGGIETFASGGVVEVGSAATLGSSGTYGGSIALITGTTFRYASSANQTISGVISGAGAVSKTTSSTSTLTLSASNTYTGSTTVSAGTLSVTDAGALGAASAGTTVDSGATLLIDTTGASGITVAEPLTLSGTGVSSGGALRSVADAANTNTVSGAISLAASAEIQSDSGTLALDVVSGNAIDATSGSPNVTFDGSGNTTVNDPIDTPVSGFTKQGTGTVTLSATNTHTGSTTVSAGTLSISNDLNLGAVPGSGLATAITLNGGTLEFTDDVSIAPNRGITLGSFDGTISVATGKSGTIGTIIAGLSGADLTKSGAGTLTMNGINSYVGATTISAGTLKLGGAGVLSDSTAVSVASGATFDLNSNAETVGSIAGAGSITLSADLTAGGDNSTTEFSGTTSANSGRLTKAGTGTLTLSGDNLHTGGLTVTGGVVSVSSDAKLGANPGAVTATSVTLNGGTLKATATFTLSTTRGITLGSSHGTIEVVTGATVTYDGVIAGASANLTKTGAGTLTLGGTNTYSGSTTIGASGGVLLSRLRMQATRQKPLTHSLSFAGAH
ncbi:MAG: hypothetical protein EBT09_02790, partial [Actinobacteria bacterium]|nr:hypothetical protein [Actinomycetota bacterium]